MLDPRDSRLWQTATQLGLVDPERLEACWDAIPVEKRTPDAIDRRLARQAVTAGLLTLWQAQQILAGRQNGLRIGRYVLLDQIGHGGMGRVYLARDTRLGRPVAIKVLSRERSQSPRALARFRREARVGAQLQHENLIRVYDEGEYGGMPYLVMEYIEGRTVAQLIAEQGPLDPRAAADLARQVALGLDHLHQKGLLHRDVNPANILVDRDGTAKLTDLGLAIDLNDAEDVVTRDGATVGTFDYISPEQARNPRQIDTRSDIYSLGCSLYQMIAGRVPFPAQSLPEKLFAHQSAQAEPLTSLAPGTPEGLDAVVRKMMAKSPADRYARPADAARALEPFARNTKLSTPGHADRARSLWDSATAGAPGADGSPPPGSEPGLAPVGAAIAAPPAQESSSDPFDLFKIDLGDEGSSSTPASTAPRTRTTDQPAPRPPLPRWLLALAPLALGLLLVALVTRGCEKSPEQRVAPRPPLQPPPRQPTLLREAPITVEYRNGDAVKAESLADAIRLSAANRSSEVVLRNEAPLDVEVASALSVTEPVVIRAADGARPSIRLRFQAAEPFLVVAPHATVVLEGLDIVVEAPAAGPAPPAVFQVGGRLQLDRCTLIARAPGPALAAVLFSGRNATLSGCWIEGFRPAVRATLFPGSNLHVQQTVLHPGSADPAAAGWALELVSAATGRGSGERRIALHHVTAVGIGLAGLEKVTTAMPIRFDVASTVVSGRALLRWGGAQAFPDGIVWKGEANLYDLSGDRWVVADAAALTPVPDAPAQLDAWARGPIAEVDTRAIQARFRVGSTGAGRTPLDYAVTSVDPPRPGADPSQVPAPPGR